MAAPGALINGYPGTGTTWGHGRRRADGTVEITAPDMQHFHEQGFIILRRAFSEQRMAQLLAAVKTMVAKGVAHEAAGGDPVAAAGAGPGLQWIDREKEFPTRTSNMLWPDKYEPAFGDWLEDLWDHLHAVIDHGGSGVRNSLFGMLSSGAGVPYEQHWHHDGESAELGKITPGNWDVRRSLAMAGHSVQINAPLLPHDHFLQLVPASHLRPSTTDELAAGLYTEQLGLTPGPMPGGVTVELEPGDIVYYNSQFWHRGWNPEGLDRWTLHCSWSVRKSLEIALNTRPVLHRLFSHHRWCHGAGTTTAARSGRGKATRGSPWGRPATSLDCRRGPRPWHSASRTRRTRS
eukprot:SAG22_NODE_3894_length_1480_cov_1.296886_1_plen_348_part_00